MLERWCDFILCHLLIVGQYSGSISLHSLALCIGSTLSRRVATCCTSLVSMLKLVFAFLQIPGMSACWVLLCLRLVGLTEVVLASVSHEVTIAVFLVVKVAFLTGVGVIWNLVMVVVDSSVAVVVAWLTGISSARLLSSATMEYVSVSVLLSIFGVCGVHSGSMICLLKGWGNADGEIV